MENSAHLPDGDTRRAFVNEKLCHGAANTCAEGLAFAKCFGHVALELPGLNAKCLAKEGQGIGFDVLDVPRDEFVVAGDAWIRCRAGDADPARFGFSPLGQGGYWWIAGNLLRDVAALNNMEMLPWDVWGAMPGPGEPADTELFDHLAAQTIEPDATLAELTARYASDARLTVPGTVYNAVLDRSEILP